VVYNSVPYEEPFEKPSYTNGYDITGEDGWYGDAGVALISTNSDVINALKDYTNTVGRLPIPTNHTKVLQLMGTGVVSNLVDASNVGGTERVFSDFMLMPTHSAVPPAGAGESLSLYVNTSSNLVIWHRDAVTGPEWLELATTPALETGKWARITMEQNYAGYRFQVRVNAGAFISHADGYTTATGGVVNGTWFNMVQTNGTSSTILFSEAGYIDDLQVEVPIPSDVPGDWQLDILDMFAYVQAWKTGQDWSIPPNPIDIQYMFQTMLIWKSGEYYDQESAVYPFGWVVVNPTTGGVGSPAMGSMVGTPYAERSFGSATYTPGVPLLVTIDAVTDASVVVYAIEEEPPAGWTDVQNISDDGAWDPVNKKVKWAFFDGDPRTLTYEVIPPGGASGLKTFTGVAAFGAGVDTIGGDGDIDSGAALKITGTTVTAGTNFGISWDAQSGMIYSVWWKDDLLSDWLPGQVDTTTGGYWEDTNFVSEVGRFYRLTAEPAP
jgi:hypothetical protein